MDTEDACMPRLVRRLVAHVSPSIPVECGGPSVHIEAGFDPLLSELP